MRNFITYEDISRLARPCTTEPELAEAMIAEAQRVELKPRLGDALYVAVGEDDKNGRFRTLLDGGQWKDRCGETRLLTGLRTALAYYALARIIRDGNIMPSTYGAVIKDDQYSVEAEKAERQRQYRELFAHADSYMAEVLQYLSHNRGIFPEYKACSKASNNRFVIKTIGK